MKKIIKKIVPQYLWSILKQAKYGRYSGLNNLDQKLEKYLNYNNGYFVELGANDGVSQSNTLYYEKYKGWRGVLIEPTPHNYLLCRENRSPTNKIFCNACVSFDYKQKFVEIAYSNLMSAPLGLESDISNPLEHAAQGKEFLKPSHENFIFGALAKPLSILLDEANAPLVIDFLSLDVEGAEIEVLKGIDHSKYIFKFMCIETRNQEKIALYLDTVGYKMIERLSTHDYLFGSS